MILADRLKKSVEEIIQMSTLELKMWAGYMMYESDATKKHITKQNMPPMPRPRRK